MREKYYIQNLMEGHCDIGMRQKLIGRQEALQQRHHHLLVPVLHICHVKGRPTHSDRRVFWSVHVGQLGYSPVEQELRQSGASYLWDIPLRKHSSKGISGRRLRKEKSVQLQSKHHHNKEVTSKDL